MNLEHDLIHWLRDQTAAHPAVDLSIGDDAALLCPSELSTVVTTDLLSDRIDFILDEVPAEEVGHKALAVNLSDLAAMAARPTACFVSLLLPTGPRPPLELAKALYLGLLPLAGRFNCALAGGDTNTWDGGLVISVTAMGSVTDRGPLTRSGARPGDALLATGTFGGSILGRHLRFTPRVEEALLLAERYELHAGLDVSDGLALDLHRMCEASRCGAVLDPAAVPVSDDARQLSNLSGRSPLDHALGDGEDFELLLAVPQEEADRIVRDQPLGDVPVTRIGTFVSEPGIWSNDPSGERTAVPPTGYQHGGPA